MHTVCPMAFAESLVGSASQVLVLASMGAHWPILTLTIVGAVTKAPAIYRRPHVGSYIGLTFQCILIYRSVQTG